MQEMKGSTPDKKEDSRCARRKKYTVLGLQKEKNNKETC
jgi:hypothetical protein